jgi:hypothetical protein
MITTNQQKKTLVDRLYRDNHITLDEVLMLVEDGHNYTPPSSYPSNTIIGGPAGHLNLMPPFASISNIPGTITNLSGTVTPTSI